MLFSSEHGFYYSYFKALTDEPNFSIGYNRLLYDNLTEYPNTINAIHKFNIVPEVIIGWVDETVGVFFFL